METSDKEKKEKKEYGFLKTGFWVSISTIIKLLCNFITGKVFAIFLGPAGYAIIGQFQNISSMFQTFSTGCITNGIVKYTAEYKDRTDDKESKILSSGILITLFCSLILSLVLLIGAKYFSVSILHSEKYISVFRIFGFTLVLYALNNLFISVINGHKEYKKYVTVNIVQSIVGLIFTVILSIKFGVWGALVAYVTFQSVVFFVTLSILIKSSWFKIKNFTKGIDKESLINLSKFALMTMVAFLIMPYIQIFIRNYVITHISMEAAGILQGMWKISESYLLILVTTNSIYYIPKLSGLKTKHDLKQNIITAYKLIIPISCLLAVFVFIFKTFLIKLFFTDTFLPMTSLFLPQLIGDVIKMAARILFLVTVARAMTFWSIFSENSVQILFAVLSIPLINHFGLVGVTYSHIISNIVFLLMMIVLFRKILFKKHLNNKTQPL